MLIRAAIVLLLIGSSFPSQAAASFQEKPGPLPPEPDAKTQKETQKIVRELFKEDYARKAPADQQALARRLLQKGAETRDDSTARYVLLQEARDLAAQAGDPATAIAAADEMARSFIMDGTAMKLALLAKLAAQGRDAEALRAVAAAYLAMVPDAVSRDEYDAADTAATKAEGLAKAAKDLSLLTRAQAVRKDTAAVRSEYQKFKAWMQNPAAGEGEGAGAFLCFMKGDWTSGLPLLADAPKSPFQAIAAKDRANPAEPAARVEVGDGWWDAAQKEKLVQRKMKMLDRMRTWYTRALPDLTGLVRVKVEKRLGEFEDLEDVQLAVVRPLRFVDLKQDAVAGEYTLEGGVLTTPAATPFARIQIPYTPPEEYDLSFIAVRKAGANTFAVGLTAGDSQCMVAFDADTGEMNGLDMIEGKGFNVNETTFKGRNFLPDKPVSVVCSVRKGSVSVALDGRKVIAWKGDFKKLGLYTPWVVPRKNVLFFGTWQSSVQVSNLVLTPVTGQGRKAR